MTKESAGTFFYCLIVCAVILIAHIGNRVVTVIVETTPIPRRHCIIVDAGHGGIDGGATSCTGVLESAYNLEVAKRLDDLLHLIGFDTKMTRIHDVSIYTKGDTIAQKKASDLKERVRIVNETENSVLLSIHQNNFSDSRYSGAQVFYGASDGSKVLATQLQKSLSILDPTNNRIEKKSQGIYLMEHITSPGVLIECGFLSNPKEEALLRNKDYQQKLCCVIAATLSSFLSNT